MAPNRTYSVYPRRGLVFSDGYVDFAQASDYLAGFLFYPDSSSTIAQTLKLNWDEANAILFFNAPIGTLGGLIMGTNGEYLSAIRTDGSASFRSLWINNSVSLTSLVFFHNELTYASTVNLDFDGNGVQTLNLTGNVTFTTSNREVGKSISIRIISNNQSRNLTFPNGWKFLPGPAPTSIAANKVAKLAIEAYGVNDTDVLAAYSVQS